MDNVTVQRLQPGIDCWSVHLDGQRIGTVGGTKELGYEWSSLPTTGCHGITRLASRDLAVQALVEHVQSHQPTAVA